MVKGNERLCQKEGCGAAKQAIRASQHAGTRWVCRNQRPCSAAPSAATEAALLGCARPAAERVAPAVRQLTPA
eukprot:scaffold72451_cov54-Phaeocystis_antarctica.AAC.1